MKAIICLTCQQRRIMSCHRLRSSYRCLTHRKFTEEENMSMCFLTFVIKIAHLFFQAAWEEVEESLVELAQTRSRVQQLRRQLQARNKEAELEVSGTAEERHNDTLALWVTVGFIDEVPTSVLGIMAQICFALWAHYCKTFFNWRLNSFSQLSFILWLFRVFLLLFFSFLCLHLQ